jgi:hypothetical protein
MDGDEGLRAGELSVLDVKLPKSVFLSANVENIFPCWG